MKKKLIIATILIVITSTWVIKKIRTPGNAVKTNTVWVQASTVKETTLPMEVKAIGTLVASSVEISPETSGHIQSIPVADGSAVKQGEVLMKLEDGILRAKLAAAKARLQYIENDYKRISPLAKQKYLSQRDIDKAQSELKERKGEVQEIEAALQNMQLTAPFAGVIGKRRVNLGDFVTVGQSVVTLTDTQHLRVEYTIPEKYLSLVKLGQSVSIISSAYPDQVFKGTVAFISPTINTDNRSVLLYANILNEEGLLKGGMFVTVKQLLGKNEHALMIPARSLIPVLDGLQVYKVVDGKAYAFPVTTGARLKDDIQILQGVTIGDSVITDGQHKVKSGMPVNVKT